MNVIPSSQMPKNSKNERSSLKNERYLCSIWSIPWMSEKCNSFQKELSSSDHHRLSKKPELGVKTFGTPSNQYNRIHQQSRMQLHAVQHSNNSYVSFVWTKSSTGYSESSTNWILNSIIFISLNKELSWHFPCFLDFQTYRVAVIAMLSRPS